MSSKKLWALISKLERAIKDTMESSPEIADLVERIQAEGVEVSLNCIALFSDPRGRAFTSPAGKTARGGRKPSSGGRPSDGAGGSGGAKQEEKPARAGGPRARKKGAPPPASPRGRRGGGEGGGGGFESPSSGPKLELNEKDREFLRSIGIRFD